MKDCAVVIDKSDEYTFAKIEFSFHINGVPYLLVQELTIVEYDSQINAYFVTKKNSYKVFQLYQLLDYHPLAIYKVCDSIVITLRHKIYSK